MIQDINDIIGKQVLTRDGREIGRVQTLQIDPETWRVMSIGVKVARERLEDLDLRRPLLGSQSILVPTGEITAVADVVMLSRDLPGLREISGLATGSGEEEATLAGPGAAMPSDRSEEPTPGDDERS